MCTKHSKKRCCLNPEQKRANPGNCSPKQIKECHGDEKHHPCEKGRKENFGK